MSIRKLAYNGSSKILKNLVFAVNALIDGGGGGGSGDTVTWTQELASGTEIARISINGNSQSVYAPSPPVKLSDLTNDSGFITSTVSNLSNYYRKTETYTQAEVDSLISAIVTLNIEVVRVLPTTGISRTTIYLVPKSTAGTDDIYDEYINLNGTSSGWEHIGSTQIDLSNYYTKAEINALLADKANSSDIPTAVSELANDSDYSSVQWSQYHNSGTRIATIKIDGISTDIYVPSGGSSDCDPILEGMARGRLDIEPLIIDHDGNHIITSDGDHIKAEVTVIFNRME